jgi:signal transduction histidine kinase
LFTNAVKYSREEKEILVRLARHGANAAIEVSDRGVGIEPRNLERIFDKFFSTWQRMDDRAQGGLGLGLTLSREIVRAHGGELGVRSEVGSGSTFTVSLPLEATEAAPMPAPQPAPEDLVEARLGGQRG